MNITTYQSLRTLIKDARPSELPALEVRITKYYDLGVITDLELGRLDVLIMVRIAKSE